MEPFEAIKQKAVPSGFTPNSCKLRPQTESIGKYKSIRKKVLSPPAVGCAGRAVMVKKQMRQVMLPTATTRVPQGSPFKSPSNTISPPMSPMTLSPLDPSLAGTLNSTLTAYKSPKKTHTAVSPVPAPAPPPRDGCTVDELAPAQCYVPNLKKLDLDKVVPDLTSAEVRTPRFCIPATLEVKQGSGAQVIHNFATNPDSEEPGIDQALCYNVWAHTTEIFCESGLPTIDCEGSLSFTPSYHLGGVSLVTITLSDNAAVGGGTVKTSPPLTLKLMVVPGVVSIKKSKDWRSQTTRQNLPVAVLSPITEEALHEEWAFQPGNIHSLREKTRTKGHQDKSLRKMLGVCPLEIIYGHRYAAFEQEPECDVSPEREKALLAQLSEGDSVEAIENLRLLARSYSARGGAVNSEKCVKIHKRVVGIFAQQVGIDDEAVAVPGSVKRSMSLTGGPTDELTKQHDQYGLALCDLAHYYTCNMAYRDARKALEKAVSIFEVLHGADHQLTAKGYLLLAECLSYEHRHDRALELAKRAASSSCLVYRRDDVNVIEGLHLSAYCLRQGGTLSSKTDGLEKHKAAHELLIRSTIDSYHLVESHLLLADAHSEMGEWQEAMRHAEEAVMLASSHYPNAVAHAQVTAGGILLLQSRYDERGAKPYLSDAATNARKGTDIFRFKALSACLDATQEKLDDAIVVLRECEKGLANTVAPTHPLLCRLRVALAGTLLRHARLMTPKERHNRGRLLRECLQLVGNALHSEKTIPWDPQVASTYELLGDLHIEMKDWKKALEAFENARGCLEATNIEVIGAPGGSGALNRLYEQRIEMLLLSEEPADSDMLEVYEAMLRKVQRAYGEWDGHTVYPMLNLAEVCYVSGEYDLAHRHFARSLAIVDSQNMHFLLGNLFKPSSQLKQTEVQERNRLAAERMTPLQCTHLGMILSQIGTVYEKQGVLTEAETSYIQTLAAYEIAGQPHSLGCCYALDSLARLLFFQGQYGDALSYFEKAYGIRYTVHGHLKAELELSLKNIHVVNSKVRQAGYQLIRHEVPGRFPVYY